VKVIKRDGRKVDYDEDKVSNAINKAFTSVGNEDKGKCKDLAKEVTNSLIAQGDGEYHIEFIQDLVEKTLIHNDLADIATEYILYRANRTRVREMNGEIMKQMQELTFGNSNDVELKRENANIDGDTAMGTMLRYGTEVAKVFNFNYLVSPDIAKAHKQGDIHIHDADFMALTETCMSTYTYLTFKNIKNNYTFETMANYLDEYFEIGEEGVKPVSNLMVKEANGEFVEVKNCARHILTPKEKMYLVKTESTQVCLTGEHRVPIHQNGERVFVHVKELVVNDLLYVMNKDKLVNEAIRSIEIIKYTGYVYDMETSTNLFLADNVLVHNCCQIDLEKLFKGGFNTGHGYVREPAEIRSYSALACIALQSNQNEMH
jgi:transcriptional regulator NrdR family protein